MKYKINYIIALGALLCLSATDGFAQNNQYTTEIYGKVAQFKTLKLPKKLTVVTQDFFNQQANHAYINGDGSYKVRFQKYYEGRVFLKYRSHTQSIYIRPGEKLQVNWMPIGNTKNLVEFLGESPSTSLNQTITQWKNYQTRSAPYHEWMRDLTFAQLQDSVTQYTRSELKRLQQFCLSSQCSGEFLQWARTAILYTEAHQLMRFRWYQPVANNKSPLKVIPKGYNYSFTYKFSLNQPRALKTLPYCSYIHEHNQHWRYIAYSKKVLDSQKIDREKELAWIIKNTEQGLARDLMLAENYGALVQEGNQTLIKKLTPLFLKYVQFVPARDYIKELN
ncbi:hypothetical protein [Microscilla marina]|uniref:Lipoprotein n=1 Tax=Microscilla marina ATCC 23134 TaxID=313606 RepID=A1ZJC3_MICM2|nr:hypothetical protein [Microscilla marina]EAY29659.1 hypothetical protein M23134_00543 [Microscilla marina ATCC 23134]